ncbi:Hypothetical predicted protein [Octopus vulgaris]|uniref:Uncharacterized protein n=1 Tax=Octopus vulgaris TaxID=6645 RepID=A0AA36B9B7_OCTVU|nr:Hypothetical predicted protein [Octopus vulgaris]
MSNASFEQLVTTFISLYWIYNIMKQGEDSICMTHNYYYYTRLNALYHNSVNCYQHELPITHSSLIYNNKCTFSYLEVGRNPSTTLTLYFTSAPHAPLPPFLISKVTPSPHSMSKSAIHLGKYFILCDCHKNGMLFTSSPLLSATA